MNDLSADDVERGAMEAASTVGERYLLTRFPELAPPVRRFIAKQIVEIMYPFVKVAAFANLSTRMEGETDPLLQRLAPVIADMAAEVLRSLHEEAKT